MMPNKLNIVQNSKKINRKWQSEKDYSNFILTMLRSFSNWTKANIYPDQPNIMMNRGPVL
jgi:hypothetical protein